MTKKHVGGRGRKASNKHQSFSISLPPHLKDALDAAVTEEVSRSEVVAGLIEAHLLKPVTKEKSAPAARPPAPARAAAPQKKAARPPATNLPAAVTVMTQQVKRGLSGSQRSTPLLRSCWLRVTPSPGSRIVPTTPPRRAVWSHGAPSRHYSSWVWWSRRTNEYLLLEGGK